MRTINSIFKVSFFLFILTVGVHTAYSQTAALLPVAPQQFFDKNGNPVSSGSVGYYIPGTSTPKMVWQDDSQTTPWTNPITLNAGGWPPNNKGIYGNGTYRQILKDKNNNIISDQPTSATGSGGGSGTSVGDGNSVGTILTWSGMIAPNQYQFAYGQALSRTTYPELLQAVTLLTDITCVGGNTTLTGITDTSNIPVGANIEANCVVAGSTVVSKTLNTVTLSIAANISNTTSGRFFPYGNGNGTTTFNAPDLRGKVIPGRTNMGGVTASNLTNTYYGSNPDAVGANGGTQSKTIVTANLPPYTPTGVININDPGHNHSVASSVNSTLQPGGANIAIPSGNTVTGNRVTGLNSSNVLFDGTPQGGTSTAFAIIPPSMTMNYIIKVTPDTSVSGLFGVASIGGMQGIITCGTGLTCAGNDISIGAFPPNTSDNVSYTAPVVGALTSSVTQALYNSCLPITQFGAVGDNSTDNLTAFNLAITAATASNKCIGIPDGIFRISGSLNNIPPKIGVVGNNRGSSIIRTTSASANVLTLNGGSSNVSNLTIDSSVIRSGGVYIDITTNSSTVTITDVNLDGAFIGIRIPDTVAIVTIRDVFISNTVGVTGNSIVINGGFVIVLDGVIAHGNPASPAGTQILINKVEDLTITNSQFITAVNPMFIVPTAVGEHVGEILSVNSQYDGATAQSVRITPGAGTYVTRVRFLNGWINGVLGSDNVIATNVGGGTIDGLSFDGVNFPGTSNGTGLNITGVSNFNLSNSTIPFHTTGVSLTNVNKGSIIGNKIGDTDTQTGNITAISLSGTTDNVAITGNTLIGNSTALSNTSSGTANYSDLNPGLTTIYPVRSANTFLSGPSSGAPTNPTYRTMTTTDLPSPFTNGTRSGNTSQFVTTTGTLTSGDCVKIDASGNFIANGSACGGGGSSPGGSNTQVQFNNAGAFGGSANMTWVSPKLTIGTTGTTGQFGIAGTTSGNVTQTVQAIAGTPTITWGNTSGTPAVTATSPLAITASTGNMTCTTCGVTGSPLSQFAATTSAQLLGVISDETGSGLAVFNNGPTLITPTFTTSATVPLIVGGSGTTGTQLSLKTTTGVGTTDAIAFLGGNNGATTYGIWNATGLGINTTPSSTLHVNAPSGTATLKIQNTSGTGDWAYAVGSMYFTNNGTADINFIGSGASSNITFAPGSAVEKFRINSAGHLKSGGTIPTIGTCGTSPAIATGSTDAVGNITTGSTATTSCIITFATAYTAAPVCTATPEGAANSGLFVTPSTGTLTLTYTSATSLKINYHCYERG